MGPKLCAVSIDVDPIACYYQIHGLGLAPSPAADLILERALPRFVDLLQRYRIPATFFLVGNSLELEIGQAAARGLAQAGFELGNHSYSHPYEFGRLDKEAAGLEIDRAHERIVSTTGQTPVGFRAPGYAISTDLCELLGARQYLYDSSLLPSPSYYGAKALVLLSMTALGRRSGSVLVDPRTLLAPASPYRPDGRRPWQRGSASIVELPVATTPWLRLPAIGTTLVVVPAAVRKMLVRSIRQRGFFNFELHAIDLLDAEQDEVPPALVRRQPDLRRPMAAKLAALAETLELLLADGFEFARLKDVAAKLQGEL